MRERDGKGPKGGTKLCFQAAYHPEEVRRKLQSRLGEAERGGTLQEGEAGGYPRGVREESWVFDPQPTHAQREAALGPAFLIEATGRHHLLHAAPDGAGRSPNKRPEIGRAIHRSEEVEDATRIGTEPQ